MKINKLIILNALAVLLLIVLPGCPNGGLGYPDGDSTVNIMNNSDKTLYFYFDYDTLISNESFEKYPTLIINPHSNESNFGWWKKIFSDTAIDKLHLFLFDKTVVDSVPWDTIRVNNMYLKRIDFDLHILDSLKWTLIYP